MAISAKDVMSLRQRTGVGMMDCKSALVEAEGDMEAAIVLLREKLKGKMDERTDRQASEGTIAIAQRDDDFAMIELICETDFSARNDSFVEGSEKIAELALASDDGNVSANDEMTSVVDGLRITIKENVSLGRAVKFSGRADRSNVGFYLHHNRQIGAMVETEGQPPSALLTGLCQHIAAAVPPLMPAPLAVDESGLPQDQLEQQKASFIEEAQTSGKPENIIEKMVVGKIRKWVDEHTLLGQTYIRELDAKKPVRAYLPEGAKILRFVRYAIGE